MAAKRVTPCARCAAKSCTCGLPRRRPSDSERLDVILRLLRKNNQQLVQWNGTLGRWEHISTRSDIDAILREEARRGKK